jgi:menaquinol-cytochrome c reductase cytochrome b/c subunit
VGQNGLAMTQTITRAAITIIVLTIALAACGGDGATEPHPNVTVPRDATSVAAGQTVYSARCASCHRADLRGAIGPSLASVSNGRADDYYVDRISNGRGSMPGFGDDLGTGEIRAVIDYIRSVQAAGLEE